MKHYKSKEILSIFRMSSLLHKRKAPLLKTFWRRFRAHFKYTAAQVTGDLHAGRKNARQKRCKQPRKLRGSVASLAALRPNLQFLAFFQFFWIFLFLKKMSIFGPFWQIKFLCRFSTFEDDFGRFLDTVSGCRMINFHLELCTRIYKF